MSGRPTEGIVRSGRRMLAILVRMVQTRLSLVAVEVAQEKQRIWLLLVLTVVALIFASLALLMLSLLVIVAFWDDNRLLAIEGLLALYVVAAGVTLAILRSKAMGGSSLFAGTLDELAKDEADLDQRLDDLEAERWRG